MKSFKILLRSNRDLTTSYQDHTRFTNILPKFDQVLTRLTKILPRCKSKVMISSESSHQNIFLDLGRNHNQKNTKKFRLTLSIY